nr:hypothetical protein Iba_chr05fCG3620 [Ipomoea batatas]
MGEKRIEIQTKQRIPKKLIEQQFPSKKDFDPQTQERNRKMGVIRVLQVKMDHGWLLLFSASTRFGFGLEYKDSLFVADRVSRSHG